MLTAQGVPGCWAHVHADNLIVIPSVKIHLFPFKECFRQNVILNYANLENIKAMFGVCVLKPFVGMITTLQLTVVISHSLAQRDS